MPRLKRKKPPSRKKKVFFMIFIAILMIKTGFIGRGSFLGVYRSSLKAKQNKQQYEDILAKIDKTDEEINRILHDEEYLIKIAREEYNMQRKDEHVIKLIESSEKIQTGE